MPAIRSGIGKGENDMRSVSVTQCLSILDRFKGISYRVLMQAAERGTRVHKYSLAWVKGLYLPVPDDIAESVEGFKRWFELMIDEVLCVEEPLEDRSLCLTGRVDLIARIRGERLFSVIDLKASTVDWSVGLQLAAYHEMAQKQFRRKLGTRFALPIQKDGSIKAVPFRDPNDWPIFLGVLSAYNHSRKMKEAA